MHEFRHSSNLAGAEYDATTQTLMVAFRNGTRYSYAKVPPATYEALTHAPSAGQYFHAKIRGAYAAQREEDT